MKAIETERLILREWKESDLQDLFEYTSSELVGSNAGWKPHENIEESEKLLNALIEHKGNFAIVLKPEDKVIGGLGIHESTPDESLKEANQKIMGVVLNPKYWGNGYVPEALEELIRYGFEEEGLDIIWGAHYEDNHRSKRVISKCGLKYKFSQIEELKLFGNKKVETLYYNIMKDDFKSII